LARLLIVKSFEFSEKVIFQLLFLAILAKKSFPLGIDLCLKDPVLEKTKTSNRFSCAVKAIENRNKNKVKMVFKDFIEMV
jgi:hypothetical protein